MLETGSVFLDIYKIIKIAGKGGMGCVYLAEDTVDHSRWAIKEEKITDQNRELLLSEARILMNLRHPALPGVRRIVETEDTLYIVMEFMEGDTLQNLIDREKRFPEERVLRWFQQIVSILIYLHSLPQPVVYRDLKPANIIIDPNDHVKMIDFGIAKEYRQPAQQKQNYIVLSRGFGAPEQYSSKFSADVRTDIYALGATIHYLLTGKDPRRPPFRFDPVRKLAPGVSLAMEQIVKKCLQPNPDKRYRSAEELAAALDQIELSERSLRKAYKRRRLLSAGGSAVLMLALCFVFVQIRTERESEISQYYSLLALAEQAMEQDDLRAAQDRLREAIAYQPDAPEAYIRWAGTLLAEGKYDECLAYVREELLDRFPEIYQEPEFLLLMGEFYSGQENYADALYYFSQRSALLPGETEPLYQLALCQIRAGESGAARETIDSLRRLNPPAEWLEKLEREMESA